MFALDSIWNLPLPNGPRPVDRNNWWLQLGFGAQNKDGSFWQAYGPNVYEVGPDDPELPVTVTTYKGPNLPDTFRVPAGGVVGGGGGDGWVAIIDRERGVELDLWQCTQGDWGLQAGGGNCFALDGSGWAGLPGSFAYSATASGAALTAGLITGDDLRSGVIAHALAIVPRLCRSGFTACPATHNDGRGWLWDPPEGARCYLPTSYVPNPKWPAVARMVATALRDYGAVVVDQGSMTFKYQCNGDFSGTDLANGAQVHYPADFPWGQIQWLPITQC